MGQLAYRNETFAENALSVEQCGAVIDAVHAGVITGRWYLCLRGIRSGINPPHIAQVHREETY